MVDRSLYPAEVPGSVVTLRELTESDVAALHKVYGDEKATRHLSFEPRTSSRSKA